MKLKKQCKKYFDSFLTRFVCIHFDKKDKFFILRCYTHNVHSYNPKTEWTDFGNLQTFSRFQQ